VEPQSENVLDCIVIGGGPAGLVTAIYLKRFRRDILLVDNNDSRVKIVPTIRNLVGYADGISGKNLLHRLYKQAHKYNVPTLKGIAQVFRNGKLFKVKVDNQIFLTKNVVLATGFKDKQPEGIDVPYLCEMGAIAYCPICDGFDHSDQAIGILINSSDGFHKLRFLYNFTKRLHIILIRNIIIPARHREKIKKYKVKVHQGELQNLGYNTRTKQLSVKLKGHRLFEIDMAYVALGIKVPKDAVEHLNNLRRTKDGLIIVSPHQETSIKGIYAVGDCAKALAQISVAVGHAARAATHIHNQLNK
jgi:thioredoxin reductase (NADPH)